MSGPIAETAVRLPVPMLRPFITRYAGFRVSGFPLAFISGFPQAI
jgi:hypothetical protein